MKKLRSVTIVIPVYNEAATIKEIISRVKRSNTLKLTKEIIVVDDASTDSTAKIVKSIPGITRIRHAKNSGKGASIKTGFLKAKGDIILVQDADLEYSPSDYPKLLEPFIRSDADVVFGTRFRGSEARRVIYFTHHVANHILTFYSNLLTNLNLTDMECGYKAFRREKIHSVIEGLESKRFGIEPELTAKVSKISGIKFYEVGIGYQGRTYEEGKKIGFIDFVKALYEITYFNLLAE
jgi:glycosyltransferase involved in cell wall biosynthesis